METATFSFPTQIRFGNGVRKELPALLKSRGHRRPLIVTDRGILSLPILEELVHSLREGGVEPAVYGGVHGNPVESQVKQGVDAFVTHAADALIGFGGGAALDVAKAIALMVDHPGELFDYEDGLPNARPVDRPIPFWVAIPTTSGTGSEVGRSSVISDEKTHLKKIIFSPRLLAPAVFADPELTADLPPKMTAATGMDALTHCLEAYLAKGYHPICDGIALEGIRLIGEALGVAVREPKGAGAREARGKMMMASMMGAIAFQKGLGITHSCAHALGAAKDVHHGLANGILVDHALKRNIEAVPERFRRIGRVLELQNPAPEAVLFWLQELKAKIGIPARLREIGLNPEGSEVRDRLVQLAFEDSCHQNNPKPCGVEDFRQVFSEAI